LEQKSTVLWNKRSEPLSYRVLNKVQHSFMLLFLSLCWAQLPWDLSRTCWASKSFIYTLMNFDYHINFFVALSKGKK
jgi:hypothetical protein